MKLIEVVLEEEAQKQTKLLMDAFTRENPNAERYVVFSLLFPFPSRYSIPVLQAPRGHE